MAIRDLNRDQIQHQTRQRTSFQGELDDHLTDSVSGQLRGRRNRLASLLSQGAGAVLSTTIDQHMYVTIHGRFEATIRVSYSRTETASSSMRSSTS